MVAVFKMCLCMVCVCVWCMLLASIVAILVKLEEVVFSLAIILLIKSTTFEKDLTKLCKIALVLNNYLSSCNVPIR